MSDGANGAPKDELIQSDCHTVAQHDRRETEIQGRKKIVFPCQHVGRLKGGD